MQADQSSRTQVAEDYLTAFCSGDFERARALVAEDFSFEGPFTKARGREEFFHSAAPLQPLLRGLRILRKWEDGDESCWIYDLSLETPAGSGAVVISDWVTVRDGSVVAERLVFDTAAWAALMGPR
jgi:predicted SnoaL-like aldol condensation-catalyzing enzyme